MKRALIALNALAAVVIIAFGAYRFVVPEVAVAIYAEKYQDMMFECDHAMREHFIAKQMVIGSVTETTVRNLEATEIGLLTCHDYDMMRNELMQLGVSESRLSILGLEAIEQRATDVRTYVDIHEIRY